MAEVGGVAERLVPVASAEVLSLLAMVQVGRVGFLHRGLPAIQVVAHVVDGGEVVFRSHGRPPVVPPDRARGAVVVYEADDIDPVALTGWQVSVTGAAEIVRRPRQVAWLDEMLPRWPPGNDGGMLVRLVPGLLSGYRFAGPDEHPAG